MGIRSGSRRHFIRAASASAALAATRPVWAMPAGHEHHSGHGSSEARQRLVELNIDERNWRIGDRLSTSFTINGQMPGPLLRWTEGDDVTIRVRNLLNEPTSIHWHGLLLPFQMDGVPGVSFDGIPAGAEFDYRLTLRQTGTYWYHSHSGLQEQRGHLGPLVIDPAGNPEQNWDREHIVVLSDWTFDDPMTVFKRLKKLSHGDNQQKRTVGDLIRDGREQGWRQTLNERAMWAQMRMDPTDFADVTATTYTYLVNGHPPEDPWAALFSPGERVRLRIINGSAMTNFNLRLPGLPMQVVQSDGQDVNPVVVDELQIGVAETFDVIVQPNTATAYALVAETIDRSGMAVAHLAPEPSMRAAVPALRPRLTLTMRDMAMSHGMDHSSMDHSPMDHSSVDHSSMDHSSMDHAEMDHAAMGHTTEPSTGTSHPHADLPGVDGVAESPANRLDEPPLGLTDVQHRVLRYSQLRASVANQDTRAPERELELHLTGNMERYMWSFDGRKFSEVTEPIRFRFNERVRLNLTNDTMMAHPIHLHGMFVELVAGHGEHNPRKHTVVVKPGERLSLDLTANEPGPWAFHCHLLYHMVAGMMRIVLVEQPA